MVKLILAFVLLPFSSQAGTLAKPRAVEFFSLCGDFEAQGKILRVSGSETVSVDGNTPLESGAFCLRGGTLQPGSPWHLHAESFSPAAPGIRFPVMICARFPGKARETRWGEQTLRFAGEQPKNWPRAYGWCGDARSFPSEQKGVWEFPSERFRELPDPYRRSGMSIGNQ